MEYELAKKLREAGFPQFAAGFTTLIDECLLAVPARAELIDACGEHFGSLELVLDENRKWCWRAQSRDGLAVGRGDFPTEALARLWLALHGGSVG